MALQAAWIGKTRGAVLMRTGKGFLFEVETKVVCQVAGPCKPRAAVLPWADKGDVDAHMFCQIL